MYYEEADMPAVARTSSLVEELGKVEYVFSDKTGTLTCNIMEFRMCSIGGKAYADVVPEDKKIKINEQGQEVVRNSWKSLTLQGYYTFDKMQEQLKNPENPNSRYIDEFFTLLSVCHTVIPEEVEDQPGSTNFFHLQSIEIVYQASSPDEGALVKGAASANYVFTVRISVLNEFRLENPDLWKYLRRGESLNTIFSTSANSIVLESACLQSLDVFDWLENADE